MPESSLSEKMVLDKYSSTARSWWHVIQPSDFFSVEFLEQGAELILGSESNCVQVAIVWSSSKVLVFLGLEAAEMQSDRDVV